MREWYRSENDVDAYRLVIQVTDNGVIIIMAGIYWDILWARYCASALCLLLYLILSTSMRHAEHGEWGKEDWGVVRRWEIFGQKSQGRKIEQLNSSEGIFEIHIMNLECDRLTEVCALLWQHSPAQSKKKKANKKPSIEWGRLLGNPRLGPCWAVHGATREQRMFASESLYSWRCGI